MARRTPKSARTSGRKGKDAASSGRQAKATSRKKATTAAAAAEVEVVEEAPGEGIDTGIGVMTTLVLLVAIGMLDYMLGKTYGGGFLFK